jgi:hypothetical protein
MFVDSQRLSIVARAPPGLSVRLAAAWRRLLNKQRKAPIGNKLYVSSFLALVMPVDKRGNSMDPRALAFASTMWCDFLEITPDAWSGSTYRTVGTVQ